MKHRWVVLFAVVCTLLGSFLIWRTLLPNNRFRPGRAQFVLHSDDKRYYLPRQFHDYDDIVTVMTVHNFVRDGFWRTHGLPNRAGTPATSFHDFQHDQCQQISKHPLIYYRHRAQWMPMHSLNGDCIYTHYPPGADWFFTAVAHTGLNQFWHYKIIAIFLNVGLLIATYFWLTREVSPPAAFIATFVIGTSPAFLNWADALLFHPLQYLFLILGLLSWGRWLRLRNRGWAWLTWLLYLSEALVSYDLTVFFGLAVVGMTLVEHGHAAWRRFWSTWLLQATAPAIAMLLQITLSISLFGFDHAMHNLHATAKDRMIRGTQSGILLLLRQADEEIMPWLLIALALAAFVVVQRRLRLPARRHLLVAAVLLIGGMSFALVMPGTASYHFTMMHRHYWPFMTFALAMTLDASLTALSRSQVRHDTHNLVNCTFLAIAAAPLLLPGYTIFRNATNFLDDFTQNSSNNRHYQPANLARTSLDTVYWRDVAEPVTPASYLPVSGVRRFEPPRWLVDLRMQHGAPSHYEVWWLEPQRVKRVRLLVDASQTDKVSSECFLSIYKEDNFVPLRDRTSSGTGPFVPDPAESHRPLHYAWLDLQIRDTVRTRAIRLTCNATEDLALHQWEAYAE